MNGRDPDADRETVPPVRPDQDTHATALSPDTILSALANTHRRALLRYLVAAKDHTATFEECIQYIQERKPHQKGDRPAHAAVENALYHKHLPKLANMGVLEYDPRSRDIRYWCHEPLETWLEYISAMEPQSDVPADYP